IRLGWCEIQDPGGSYDDVALYRKLYQEGKIKLRIYKAVYGPTKDSARLLREGASVGDFDDRFTLRTIKVVFDGALGSRGAALLEPYSDDPKNTGLLLTPPEHLRDVATRAFRLTQSGTEQTASS
ncbi:MAG: hypothetical protein M3362_25265, partial [Acidobacteriota bacterium]|nr:hypothetical protein [Acidobacteriota bacterium]